MPARPKKADPTPTFAAKLAAARLPERTVEICLRGDLVADHEAAERDLEQAQQAGTSSLAGNGSAEIIERIDALEAEMRESSVTFRVRAMPRPRWRALLAEHPPRRGDDGEIVADDAAVLINTETFYDALIRACVVEPEMTGDDWDQLSQVITDRQFGDLSLAAWMINRGEVDVPFSLAASRMKRATAGE